MQHLYGIDGELETLALRCSGFDPGEMGDDELFNDEEDNFDEQDQLDSMAFSAYGDIS